MPEICRFYGIIVRMFVETGAQHHIPHIHVYYQNHQAVYGILPVEQLAGVLPRRQKRLLEAWMELYQAELLDVWEQIHLGQPFDKIPPLER